MTSETFTTDFSDPTSFFFSSDSSSPELWASTSEDPESSTPVDSHFNNVDTFCDDDINAQIQSAGNTITSLAENFAQAVIPMVSVGAGTNLILLALILRQLCHGGAKRRYLFLCSRVLVDTVTCLSVLIVVVHRRQHPDEGKNVTAADGKAEFVPYGSPVLNAFVQFNFWILCSTYFLLSMITFVAVRFPFFYRTRVTTRSCCLVLIVNMALGVGYSILCCQLGLTPFLTMEFEKPQSLIAYTPIDNLKRAMWVAIGGAIFILVLWVLVFAQYIHVLVILVRLRAKRTDNMYRAHWNSSLRLSTSILIWTLMCALMVAAVISPPLWNYRNTEWLKNYQAIGQPTDQLRLLCLELASIATSLRDLIMISISAESIWFARFVLDPFLCVCFDTDLRAFCAGNIKRLSTYRGRMPSTEKTTV